MAIEGCIVGMGAATGESVSSVLLSELPPLDGFL
jgi:hypothetical protein